MKAGLVAAVVLSIIAGIFGQMTGIPGGFFPGNNQNGAELQKAVTFAVGELGGRYQLQNVMDVRQQVVSGMMYIINAMVLKDNVSPHWCYFNVQSQPWMTQAPHTLHEFGCRQMQVNQMFFNQGSVNQGPANQGQGNQGQGNQGPVNQGQGNQGQGNQGQGNQVPINQQG